MTKIKNILEAYLLLVLYRMGFAHPSVRNVVEDRKLSCESCVLRKGNWCSSRKTTLKCDGNRDCVKVSGCACWLPAKRMSDIYSNPCPLKRWSSLDEPTDNMAL